MSDGSQWRVRHESLSMVRAGRCRPAAWSGSSAAGSGRRRPSTRESLTLPNRHSEAAICPLFGCVTGRALRSCGRRLGGHQRRWLNAFIRPPRHSWTSWCPSLNSRWLPHCFWDAASHSHGRQLIVSPPPGRFTFWRSQGCMSDCLPQLCLAFFRGWRFLVGQPGPS